MIQFSIYSILNACLDKKNCVAFLWFFIYRPPETTPECCQIWDHRRWCSSCAGTLVLLQSDRLLWRLACDQGACTWSLQRQNITSCSSNIDKDFKTNFRWQITWRRSLHVPLRLSSRTVLRLPRGANCRAKQSGWMLMPTRETMQGCCRECNILASWRYSEKLRQASADCRCFTMVSEAMKKGTTGSTKVKKKKDAFEQDIQNLCPEGLLWKLILTHFHKPSHTENSNCSLHSLLHLCPQFVIYNYGGLCVSV